MSRLLFLFALIVVAAAHGQATAPTSQPADDEFVRRLEAIDRRAGEIADLTADFVQEKRSPLLRKPLISRGSVKARGGLVLWDTIEPQRMQMSIDPKTLRMYYPDQKTIEEYPIEQQLGMMASSPLPRLSAIRQSFAVKPDQSDQAGVVRVRLEPIAEELRKYVDHVRVTLDEHRGVASEFEMVDPDGEHTIIRFSNVRTNLNLSDDALKIAAPAGTKVVRPLEGAGR